VTALANSLRRVWSATSRVPHQTGWGTRGSFQNPALTTTLAGSLYEGLLALIEIAHCSAPTVLLIAWNIFR
jgi:hypothetical protein